MSLRARLVLALFLLSVVPLTAVTLFSYRSSATALRQAAEVEGRQAAAEMSRRMDVVTAGLTQQLDRLWDLPRPSEAPRSASAASAAEANVQAAERVARVLGSTAVLLDRLEFVPAPPVPAVPPVPGAAAAPAGPAPPSPPRAGHTEGVPAQAPRAPRASRSTDAGQRAAVEEAVAAIAEAASELQGQSEHSAEAQKIVIDLNAALEEVSKGLQQAHGAKGAKGEAPPAWAALMTRGLAQGLQMTAAVTAEGLRMGAREVAERARTAEGRRSLDGMGRLMRGALGVPIERDGRVVGTVNAQVNLDRTLGTVFGVARSDQGEVPFAIDEDGRLFAPDAARKSTLEALGVAGGSGQAGETQIENHDNWVVVKHRDPSGLTFGIARPLGDSLEALRAVTMRNLALGLAAIGLAVIGIVPISRRMTRDLSVLAEGAQQVARGNFAARVPVRSGDEMGRLAAAFNRMAEGVEAHQKLAVEQERLQRELELCRQIQAEMLPHEPLDLGFAEIKGISIPAREVGGDFFNYFRLDDGQVALLVGDVSGKGVGAALLMANVQATLRARLPLERDLALLVDAIDRDVDERTPGGVYVTLFVGILDSKTRQLRYVNAGHHPQFLLPRVGTLQRMPSAGLPVGLYAGHGYTERTVTLGEGDTLFFYTDGMVETENETTEMFGIERLEALLTAHHEGNVDAVLQRVERAVRTFRGGAEPFDDATMMVLRVAEGRLAPAQA